jgi:hypothetical protein
MKVGWVATSPQVHFSIDTNGDRHTELVILLSSLQAILASVY